MTIQQRSKKTWSLSTGAQIPPSAHLEDLKSSNIQDADEGGSLPLPAVQSSVDPVNQPPEQTLVRRLCQSLNGKVRLQGEMQLSQTHTFMFYSLK